MYFPNKPTNSKITFDIKLVKASLIIVKQNIAEKVYGSDKIRKTTFPRYEYDLSMHKEFFFLGSPCFLCIF